MLLDGRQNKDQRWRISLRKPQQKKRKKNRKKKNKRIDFDKMPFEKREKLRLHLKQQRVYTKSFKTPQAFGAASECFSFSPEEIEYMVEVYGYGKEQENG